MRYEAERPDEVVEAIAERAAQKVAARIGETSKEPSTYLTVEEAASLLRCSRQRVHDLLSARKLRRFKDGGRTLVLRGEL